MRIRSTLVVLFLLFPAATWAQSFSFAPTGKDGETITHEEYALCYAEEHEQPWWVVYVLSEAELEVPSRDRISFKSDPLVSTGSAVDADYRNSGYDRGHLSRAEYNKLTEVSYLESFYLSNVSPQIGVNFNRTGGDWYNLEELEMQLAQGLDSLYAVSGPSFLDSLGTIGQNNQITVPGYFFKALLSPDGQFAIAFLLRHDAEDLPSLWDAAISIDSLEKHTGLDFFPHLAPAQQEAIEKEVQLQFWQAVAEGRL